MKNVVSIYKNLLMADLLSNLRVPSASGKEVCPNLTYMPPSSLWG